MTTIIATEKLLVSAREAAAMLSISTRSLWTITNMGMIPSIRIGRAVRYSITDLRDYIDAMRQGVAR